MNRTITVKGTGTVRLTPDLTIISLTLKSTDRDYGRAAELAEERLGALRTALEELGFERKALKTQQFRVCTEYESRRDEYGNYRNVFTGYACVHGLTLEFDFDTKRLSETLGAIARCVAEPELNIRFSVKDRDGAADALLKSAVENARHRAEILASASGVSLGRLMTVDYNWGELNVYSGTNFEMDCKCLPPMPCGAELEPEDIELSDSAAFVWELE